MDFGRASRLHVVISRIHEMASCATTRLKGKLAFGTGQHVHLLERGKLKGDNGILCQNASIEGVLVYKISFDRCQKH